jgi:hypothetical protein
MNWAYIKKDVPTDEHYAILEFSSIHIPGDQRSIDAPGHGYPERIEQVVKYIVFETRAEWEKEIGRRMASPFQCDRFVPLFVRPAIVHMHIETKVSVS